MSKSKKEKPDVALTNEEAARKLFPKEAIESMKQIAKKKEKKPSK